VASAVRSDHSAVVAYCHTDQRTLLKSRQQRIFRPINRNQHAQFLSHLSTTEINIARTENELEAEYSHFYSVALEFLNRFYPEKTTTVTSRDPAWMTAGLKAKLRGKNGLLRISKTIENRNKTQLQTRDGNKMEAKDIWAAVRQLTGRTFRTLKASTPKH